MGAFRLSSSHIGQGTTMSDNEGALDLNNVRTELFCFINKAQ